ncbi:threonine-phosphate decarboxylase CobD [Proteinivorax hydrogeniformans]|uniref:threonine-phosphate decarboxylase n=1 Tax=Proteinivorax hydrogeniformans TaxID=1826727 RepID=A0AAU8HVD6_9FIRM
MNLHGGDIYKYKDKNLIDFSSNINPLGVPKSFKCKLKAQIDNFTKYPDIRYQELRATIGEYLDVPCNDIVVGNGAVEIIYKSVSALDVDQIIIGTPTFSEYKRAADIAQKPCKEVEVFTEDKNVGFENLYNHISHNSLVVLCNPNNPTGTLIDVETISRLAQKLHDKNSWLLLDEAFIEFTAEYPFNSMTSRLNKFNNLIIVRAATKYFGIPGVRLGYGLINNKEMVKRIKEQMEPWSVNTAAAIAGTTIFKDQEYIKKTRKWINDERGFLFKQLKRIDNLTPIPTQANFILIKSNVLDAWQLQERLLAKNILIRTPEGFTGLSNNDFRVAIKDRNSNKKLVAALKEILM